jgi:hypothetical protein
MPNTYTKNDGRMNERQEVMRTTSNTYGHNSNRHLDRKDCKEEIREEGKEEEKRQTEKKARKSCVTCSLPVVNNILAHFSFLRLSFVIAINNNNGRYIEQ